MLHNVAIRNQNSKGGYLLDIAIIVTVQKNYKIAYLTDCNIIKILFLNWKLWLEISFTNDLSNVSEVTPKINHHPLERWILTVQNTH